MPSINNPGMTSSTGGFTITVANPFATNSKAPPPSTFHGGAVYTATRFDSMRPHEIKREAQERWVALLSISAARFEQAELREAGVPEHTIESLYGYDFTFLILGIMNLIGPRSLAHLTTDKGFGDNYRVLPQLSSEAFNQLHDDEQRYLQSPERAALVGHIHQRMPGEKRGDYTLRCAAKLWEACWYMAHRERYGIDYQAELHFLNVIERILPQISQRIAAHHRNLAKSTFDGAANGK
jgi:hypothetical protein